MRKKIEKINYEGCALRSVLDNIANKWTLLILFVLSNELELNDSYPMRFGELHKSIDSISQKMLTQTLKSLEADGLVRRKVYAQVPPKVEYSLTKMGESLIPIIASLSEWADKHDLKIKSSRKAYNRQSS